MISHSHDTHEAKSLRNVREFIATVFPLAVNEPRRIRRVREYPIPAPRPLDAYGWSKDAWRSLMAAFISLSSTLDTCFQKLTSCLLLCSDLMMKLRSPKSCGTCHLFRYHETEMSLGQLRETAALGCNHCRLLSEAASLFQCKWIKAQLDVKIG